MDRRKSFRIIFAFLYPGLGQILQERYLAGIILSSVPLLYFAVIEKVYKGINAGFIFLIFTLILYWLFVGLEAITYGIKRTSPCEKACPVGLDIPGYINLAYEGRFKEAKALIYHRTPLIGTLSYICHEPCKKWCAMRNRGGSLQIRAIKRFIFENAPVFGFQNKKQRYEEKIAIIGAGPAGLSAAYFLGRLGYQVNVFDKEKEPGGSLKKYIPEYRLPKRVIRQDIEEILSNPLIKFFPEKTLGKELSLIELQKQYDAVIIAIGASKSKELPDIPVDNRRIFNALDFLSLLKSGKLEKISGRVIIIGGGDVAAEVARWSLRKGARPIIVYRKSQRHLKMGEDVKRALEKERIEILYHLKLVKVNSVSERIQVIFKGKEEAEMRIETDFLVFAIGQEVERIEELKYSADGTIWINENYQTSLENVYACGDAVRGAGSVVEALKDGREVARIVHKRLHKFKYLIRDHKFFSPYHVKPSALLKRKPIEKQRVKGLEPILDRESVMEECERCMACNFRYR